MKRNTEIKLEEALANAEMFIEQMQQMDDRKLSKHLDLFQLQMQMAYKQKMSWRTNFFPNTKSKQ